MSEKKNTILGIDAMKWLFALEYVLQGLANPFQGITYQPIFKHFHFDYGLSESMTQRYFSQSYLAWSFKPIIGFFMDAFGRTKTILLILLTSGSAFFLLTPYLDTGATMFFVSLMIVAFLFACTDVAVDRATVISGEEESRASGRSKAATVGLNQAICWAAIYGTGIVSAFSGGWIADNLSIDTLMYGLAVVPLIVLIAVIKLPRDTAVFIPLKTSVLNFWNGLNTGPILWIILFYFLFHFQPAMGALWTNYCIETLGFSQTQIGISDGFVNIGMFIGVILFAVVGIGWQDRFGLRRIFQVFIMLSILVGFTQYLMIDPRFSNTCSRLHQIFPSMELETIRIAYFSLYGFFSAILLSFSQMSTFSLVGAVIPVNAAGSLFAGFMSVSNLAYSFSYSSGAWLYEHGLDYGFLRSIQTNLFGLEAVPGNPMSVNLLIFIGSISFMLSFLSIRMLPDRKQTCAVEVETEHMIGPIQYKQLPGTTQKTINSTSWLVFLIIAAVCILFWELDWISSVILAFFLSAFIRKLILDSHYRKFRRG